MAAELPLTAIRVALDAVDRRRRRFRDVVGGKSTWRGEFNFELIDPDTGTVERRRSLNQTVDEGENAVLQALTGIADNQSLTFDGDGSQTQFDIPHPYLPITTVNSVTVGGTAQSVPGDYAVDYHDGTLYFDTAPASGTDNVALDFDYTTYPFQWLAVGTDNTAVTEGDTALGSESSRTSLDSGFYTRDEAAVQATGQWTFGTGQANVSIQEAGIFAGPAGVNPNPAILNRTVVSPAVQKSSSEELRVTWTLSMS